MTIVESLWDWLKLCPELAGGRLNIDWLPEKSREYTVDVVPTQEIMQRYTAGASKRQFLFVLASRSFVGDDLRDAQDSYRFYEAFSAWVERCNRARSFPDLGEHRQVRSIRVTTSGYPILVSEDGMARYQIQLQMIYMQEEP